MKKIVAFLIVVVLISAANFQVFSQTIKNARVKKIPAVKSETRVIKSETPSDVKLQSVEAFSEGNGVYLRWQAEYENQNLGFLIYRDGKNGRELVSPAMIPGARTQSSENLVYGGKYSYFDANGDLASSYYIESLQSNGKQQIIGRVSPYATDNLRSVAGASSTELEKQQALEKESGVENNALVIPDEVRKEYEGNQLPPDIVTQRWVAAQPGVKISVKQEGLYRVSRTELQTAGFDVTAPGNLWQLYVDGRQQAIIVGANDSYIEFYGKGMDTPESDTKVYYLVVGLQDGLRIGTATVRALTGNIIGSSYNQSFVRKERKVYVSADVLNGEEENFFGNVPIFGSSGTPSPVTVNFDLTGVDFNMSNAVLTLGIQGITGMQHQVVPTINGELLDSVNGNGFNLMTRSYEIPVTFLREGINTLQLQAFGGSGDISLVESIRVAYARKYQAVQNQLSFYTNNYRKTTLGGFSSPNIRVFDLTVTDEPRLLSNLTVQNDNGNHRVTIPSSRGRVAFAVEDSGILTASSIVANTPSTLSAPTRNGELIIVSYSGWMAEANDWANYRRSQGLSVEVVDVEDIFDEFGYGSVSTAGMTQFFQYAKNNWQTAPNYILLIGDMSYDFRNYENRAFQNFIPTKLVDTLFEETGSDEALCDFNNDGLAELAVGRIPARSAANVTQMLNKVTMFESGLATLNSRGALCASDLPNGYDFEGVCQRVFAQLPASIPTSFINRGQADSKNLLLANMNQGRFLVNYSGHGSTGIWDGNWLTITDASAMTNSPNYSVFMMLTCLNGYFLRTSFDSLGEALVKAPNGGAAAVWASTGKTTPDVQEILATRFYNQLNVSNMTRMGDLVKDAKQNLVGGRDVRLSWALLGDPTLKIKQLP